MARPDVAPEVYIQFLEAQVEKLFAERSEQAIRERDEFREAVRDIFECLLEWQADHEHEWGQGTVLGKDGFRKRWVEKYPCLECFT